MRHHIVYWKMSRRETEVDDVELEGLWDQERRGEVYVEFLDARRLPLTWDREANGWILTMPESRAPLVRGSSLRGTSPLINPTGISVSRSLTLSPMD